MQAVIFDMDGVLIDSEPLWEKADIALLKSYGLEHASAIREQVYGRSQRACAEFFVEAFNLSDTPEVVIQKRINHLLDVYQDHLELMPHAEEVVKTLHERGLKLAIASSSPLRIIDFVVDQFALREYFEKLLSGDMVAVGKPAPDEYLEAAALLKVKPKECIVVEDSPPGIQAAKSAGMTCIALRIAANEHLDLSAADHIVDSLSEVPPIILSATDNPHSAA